MTTDEKKIKDLINSSREDQVIGINLMVYTMRWSIEDCAKFYVMNRIPTAGICPATDLNSLVVEIGVYNYYLCSIFKGYFPRFELKFMDDDFITLKDPIHQKKLDDKKYDYRHVLMQNHEIVLDTCLDYESLIPTLQIISEAIKWNLNK